MGPTHLSVTSSSTTLPLHTPTHPDPADEWGTRPNRISKLTPFYDESRELCSCFQSLSSFNVSCGKLGSMCSMTIPSFPS